MFERANKQFFVAKLAANQFFLPIFDFIMKSFSLNFNLKNFKNLLYDQNYDFVVVEELLQLLSPPCFLANSILNTILLIPSNHL